MSANVSDIILSRQSMRRAITQLRRAQCGTKGNDWLALDLRIKALEALVHGVTRDIYAIQHQGAEATP